MSAVDERSARVLAVPEKEYLEHIKGHLLGYRGRLAITMKNRPHVTILAKVFASGYVNEDECVMMLVEVGKDQPLLELLFYPRDIRNYYIFGVYNLVHEMAKNESGNDCPTSVRLLD